MANVYRLTEAAAVLSVCIESAAFGGLAPKKAAQLKGQRARITQLVANIAKYYKDGALAGDLRGDANANRRRAADAVPTRRGSTSTAATSCSSTWKPYVAGTRR
jgi:hypothetical protein